MDAKTYAIVREIVADALEVEVAERHALIEHSCGGDDRVRDAALALLDEAARTQHLELASETAIRARRERMDALLDQQPALPNADLSAKDSTSIRNNTLDLDEHRSVYIGDYRVVRRIGSGGMGTVYECVQASPKRRVAVKVLDSRIPGMAQLERFRREGEILGRLQHPGIAQIIDAGVDSGRRYLAMELVRGTPITKHVRDRELSLRARIELLARTCDAVAYAHDQGVVHRDLKPDNILVTPDGQPKVLDFGIARLLDSDETSIAATMTQEGQVLGTLSYMSPEQLDPSGTTTSPRTDVYALGVIAYELFSGRMPLDLGGLPWAKAVATVEMEEPARLSSIDTACRGDLEVIVSTCLEKAPECRYASAGAIASDLRRYLADRPIVAKPASRVYRVRKYIRRNRVQVGAASVIGLVLVMATAVSVGFAVNATRQQRATAEALRDVEQVAAFQSAQLEGLDPAVMGDRIGGLLRTEIRAGLRIAGRGDDEIERSLGTLDAVLAETNLTDVAIGTLETEIFEPTLRSIDEKFADQPLVRARLLHTMAGVLGSVGLLDAAVEANVRAWRIRRDLLGPTHLETIDSLPLFLNMDRFPIEMLVDGQPLDGQFLLGEYERGIEVLSAEMGRDHPDVVQIRLRWAYNGLTCEYPNWKSVYQSLILDAEQSLGPAHETTINAKLSFANLLSKCESIEAGHRLTRSLFDSVMSTLSESDLAYQRAMHQRAGMLWHLGEHAEAEVYAREMVSLYERYRGAGEWETISARTFLAAILESQGKLDESEQLLDATRLAAAARYKRGPQWDVTEHNLASLQHKRGRFEQAAAGFRRALESRKRTHAHTSEAVLINAAHLAMALVDLKRLDEAEEEAGWAFDLAMEHYGDDHRATGYTRAQLARVDVHRGHFAGAEPSCWTATGFSRHAVRTTTTCSASPAMS